MNFKKAHDHRRLYQVIAVVPCLALAPHLWGDEQARTDMPRFEQRQISYPVSLPRSDNPYLFVATWPKMALDISPADSATGTDNGPANGEFDDLDRSRLSILWNGFTETRVAAEFDINILRGSTISNALLTGTVSRFSLGDRGVQVDVYAGDGVVDLLDFARDQLVGQTPFGPGNFDFEFDLTSQLQTAVSARNDWLGVNLRESPECPDELDCLNIGVSRLNLQVTIDGPLQLIFADDFESSGVSN